MPTDPSAGPLALMASLFMVACATRVDRRPSPPFRAVVGPVVVAHRGGSLEAPENTVEAVRHAYAVGADWIEIDVTLSADDHLVVIHDDTLERTTNGAGVVEETKLADLRKLSAGNPRPAEGTRFLLEHLGIPQPDFGDTYAGARIPTLDEVLAVRDARLMIELKKTARGKLLVDRVVDAIARARAHDRVALGSFEADLLDLVQRRDPSLPLVGIVGQTDRLPRILELPLSVLALKADLLAEVLASVPPAVAIWVWTVYTPERALELAEQGVHGLITDVPKAVLAKLRALPPPVIPLSR